MANQREVSRGRTYKIIVRLIFNVCTSQSCDSYKQVCDSYIFWVREPCGNTIEGTGFPPSIRMVLFYGHYISHLLFVWYMTHHLNPVDLAYRVLLGFGILKMSWDQGGPPLDARVRLPAKALRTGWSAKYRAHQRTARKCAIPVHAR